MRPARERSIRPSAIAGTWYPGGSKSLRSTLQSLLDAVPPQQLNGHLRALIAPHAGFAYSGQTAAYAYRQLTPGQFGTVVVVSPNHRARWHKDFVVTDVSYFKTPLGQIPLDLEFIESVGQQVSMQKVRSESEHSIEIQLPFLQHTLGSFNLVPIMANTSSPDAAYALGETLAKVAAGSTDSVLLVASSDLHHIPDYDAVVRRDDAVVEALEAFDMDPIERVLMLPDSSVCGRVPILAVLTAALKLGGDKVQVLHRTNSGDVTGIRSPRQYTVGYLSAAVIDTDL